MQTNRRFIKKLAALLALASLASMLTATAEDLDEFTRLLMPAPFEVTATGIGPSEISLTWKDVARTEHAFEIQWTTDAGRAGNIWYPATQHPIEHAGDSRGGCDLDNTFGLPHVDLNSSDPLNQYNDPRPARCGIVLTKLRNRANTADVPLPYADPATNVRWFRMRGIFPYKQRIQGLPGNPNVEFPQQVRGLVHSPWSGIDPVILGPLPPVNTQLIPSFPSLTLVWANAAMGDPAFSGNQVERAMFGSQNRVYFNLPSSSSSYFDGPLEYNTTYTYRVSSKRSTNIPKPADPNTGADSDPQHIEESYSPSHPANDGLKVTTPPIPAPGDPTNLIATFAAPSTANLQWFDNANDEDGFLIEFGPNGVNWVAQTAIGPKQGTGFVTFSQFNILPDTVRFYRIFAFRVTPYAKSNPSNVAGIIAIPKAPSDLIQQSVASSQAVLQFKDNSKIETGFRVEYCNPAASTCPATGGTGTDWNQAGSTLPPSADTGGMLTFIDGRFATTTLKYRAIAFNNSGDSQPSNTVSSTTPTSPLNAPSNLTATADGSNQHKITLTWQDNTNNADGQPNTSDDQEEAFRIEYQDPGLAFQVLTTVPTNGTTHIDLTVPGKTTRCYRVRAVIASQSRVSDPSNKACAMTVAGPTPAAPTNLVAVPWSVNPTMAVELTWDDNSGPDTSAFSEDGFIVERSQNLSDWREVGRTGRNIASFRIGNYDPNSVQYFRVKAFNFNGHSGYSNIAQVLLKGPPRPVWLHPSKDNTVSSSACWVDGSYTINFNPAITDIAVSIVRKVGADTGTYRCSSTPGSCSYDGPQTVPVDNIPATNQVTMNWNGPGTFKLVYHFFKNVTYELHARAINADGSSADAFIPNFIVLADCPLG